ncbi:unnamed protein product [Parnassius apollo]|uniref:(apollo) hypothetical protein n=1 Tax=Parnassius apollo TaxID=110799 RepID=A0A8S3WC40_PARAO|nr:unnamed protein product [Parnassius apollo]
MVIIRFDNILIDLQVNFEELLLNKIKQDKKDINYQTKKTRVAKGAEIITCKQLEDLEKQSNETASKKAKPKKRKSIKDINFADAGPSGIKKGSKQKKTGLYRDDIDIDQYYNDETLREENWPEDLNFEMENLNSLEKYENKEISNEVKECENGNPHTKTKNKSVGKKSKAKENNQGSKETNKTDDDSSVVGNFDLSSETESVRGSESASPQKKKRVTKASLLQKHESLINTAGKLLHKKEEEWEIIGLQLKDLNKRQFYIAQKIIHDTLYYAQMGMLAEHSSVTGLEHNQSQHTYESTVGNRRTTQIYQAPFRYPARRLDTQSVLSGAS